MCLSVRVCVSATACMLLHALLFEYAHEDKVCLPLTQKRATHTQLTLPALKYNVLDLMNLKKEEGRL